MTKKEQSRAKYGKSGRAAPLIVKDLATGDVIETHKDGRLPKPLTRRQASFIKKLRRELGIDIEKMPETMKEGGRLIDSLLARKRTAALTKALDRPR